MPLRIQLVCPGGVARSSGNRVTARRWAAFLRELGHRPRIVEELTGTPDLLVALHARKSSAAALRYRTEHPNRPLVVALTGTDLYGDLPRGNRAAWRALGAADRLIVLHGDAPMELPADLRARTHVVHQSVPAPPARPAPRRASFDVCVVGHLRSVKDPLRTAMAARRLPAESRLVVRHLGAALDDRWAERARAEMARNPRYRWLGEVPRSRVVHELGRSRLLVVSSRAEGGANVIGEAAVQGVAIAASEVPGNVGLLGARHPALFGVGDTAALAELLERTETDTRFLARLERASERLAPRFEPAREREAWARLLDELA